MVDRYDAIFNPFWVTLYVDGTPCLPMRWDCIPNDQWTNVHLEAREAMSGQACLLSDVDNTPGSNMRGRMASIFVWEKSLPASHVALISNGFDQSSGSGLAAAYILENTQSFAVRFPTFREFLENSY